MGGFRNKRAPAKRKLPTGTINLSQSVTTFGVGALIEVRSQQGRRTRTASAIISGLDMWREEKLDTIAEPDLCRLLGVTELKAPPTDISGISLPARRFPRWLECNQCHRLGIVGEQFDERPDGIPACSSNDCQGWGAPTRLLSVCYSHEEGHHCSDYHIDDFPWVYWAHKNTKSGVCEAPRLRIRTVGDKTGLDGLSVICTCGASNSLKGVLGAKALGNIPCRGNQPWLGMSNGCIRNLRALLRGASNVYFPVTASTISIPPNSSRLMQLLNSTRFSAFVTLYRTGQQTAAVTAGLLSTLPEFSAFSSQKIENALASFNQVGSSRSEQERKREERDALLADYPGPENEENEPHDDFEVEIVGGDALDAVCDGVFSFINTVSLVHRLREVIAFRGFTRLESSITINRFTQRCAPIARERKSWLPAIENRGEGIYIELNNATLRKWEEHPDVMRRIGVLMQNYHRSSLDGSQDGGYQPDARLVLIHTLSHLLIRQLSLECGYASASLKERIYCSPEYCGVLISTSSAASDGTLGGLVRQGKPSNFASTLINALQSAAWCSSDPLCIDSEGQGTEALNLAACHACALISETSCELRNVFLDRALVIGTLEKPEIGFLSTLLV
ncbi:DUF1998 domain-containing protein [Aeromonas veronii]|uniref:DUF1998 domain-containing protein n=1 Tax=Aeromonas veronii TaxID=654 RepID=UPI001F1691A2|nr:DUF1998 domain-containing protein [Aeromonas veronii]MCF5902123.1 DUF1998 domain-containing protein [Aeromonas veronii]